MRFTNANFVILKCIWRNQEPSTTVRAAFSEAPDPVRVLDFATEKMSHSVDGSKADGEA
jgi:hypothetical protein